MQVVNILYDLRRFVYFGGWLFVFIEVCSLQRRLQVHFLKYSICRYVSSPTFYWWTINCKKVRLDSSLIPNGPPLTLLAMDSHSKLVWLMVFYTYLTSPYCTLQVRNHSRCKTFLSSVGSCILPYPHITHGCKKKKEKTCTVMQLSPKSTSAWDNLWKICGKGVCNIWSLDAAHHDFSIAKPSISEWKPKLLIQSSSLVVRIHFAYLCYYYYYCYWMSNCWMARMYCMYEQTTNSNIANTTEMPHTVSCLFFYALGVFPCAFLEGEKGFYVYMRRFSEILLLKAV